MKNDSTKSVKVNRYLSQEARAAMSAGAKKARASDWGLKRKPSAQIRIDADVAEEFFKVVPARDRRRVATGGIYCAIQVYKGRRHHIQEMKQKKLLAKARH